MQSMGGFYGHDSDCETLNADVPTKHADGTVVQLECRDSPEP